MKRRRLNEDDLALWRKVTDRTERLDLKSLFTPEVEPKKTPNTSFSTAIGRPSAPPAPKPRTKPHDLAQPVSDRLKSAPVQMDNKAFGKMKRGKLKPEGRIDLHGMTLDQAHPALTGFILQSHRRGKRLVLVITGKGKRSDDDGPIPVRQGVLRHQVPQWLSAAPLGPLVLQVTPAHISHGGGGAYYVYLRRQR